VGDDAGDQGGGGATDGLLGLPVAGFLLLERKFVSDAFARQQLAALFELTKIINSMRDNGANDDELKPGQAILRELTGVLGLQLKEKQGSGDADKFIDLLVEIRSEVRKQKLWALSDQIRDKLKSLGVTIEDSKDGTSWRWL